MLATSTGAAAERLDVGKIIHGRAIGFRRGWARRTPREGHLRYFPVGAADRVSPPRIRRWLRGYEARRGGVVVGHELVWRGALAPIDDTTSLGFLDLMEIRFVDAFLEAGVSWKRIRLASHRAAVLFGVDHPFATRRFVTDGSSIFAEIGGDAADDPLLDLATNQLLFKRIVAASLVAGIEFSDAGVAARWWPMGRKHHVVLDPARSMGEPIVVVVGVATVVLAEAVQAEESVERVARWFDVSVAEVRDAVAFEAKIAV
ncbi:MAG: DUF433 domain-containing protein [Alphaproteobacteria bacterium]|nr:DUF433 domain-containing protein [Alphaproteobacteria bacterium]